MPSVLAGQPTQGFLGVNLRQDRVSLADGDVAKAINADLHTQPGTILLRLGRTRQFSTALTDLAIRRLAKINSGRRYQVAGTAVYRDQVSILTGLSSNLITTLTPFRPLNDTSLWMFIADDGLMRKDDGTNVRNWGITAPTVAPITTGGAAGLLSGAYSIRFTYIRKVGAAVATESNPSPASINLVLVSEGLTISGLTASTDPQVTHVRVYRTTAGGSAYLFDQDIANGTTTGTSTIADTALGDALETDNNLPPTASWAWEHFEHMFFVRDVSNPHYAWFSKRFRPEQVPADNFLEIGSPNDPLQCGVSFAGLCAVFSRHTKYRILGNDTSSFVHQEALSRRGTPCPNALLGCEHGIIFVARDGIFSTSLTSPDAELSNPMEPLFYGETINDFSPINWDEVNQFSAAYWKGRYYFSYVSTASSTPDRMAVYSVDTRKWYFYDHPLRSLFFEEDTDDLVAGTLTGYVVVLEEGISDEGGSISLDVETKDFVGEAGANVLKFFQYMKIDADTLGDDLTVKFYVDDELRRTTTFNHDGRVTRLLSLPASTFGYRWRMRLQYTGTKRIRIYPGSAFYVPLSAT